MSISILNLFFFPVPHHYSSISVSFRNSDTKSTQSIHNITFKKSCSQSFCSKQDKRKQLSTQLNSVQEQTAIKYPLHLDRQTHQPTASTSAFSSKAFICGGLYLSSLTPHPDIETLKLPILLALALAFSFPCPQSIPLEPKT